MNRPVTRRWFLVSATAAAGLAAAGPAVWRPSLALERGSGPYGPLGAPDANGIRLPRGFRSRIVARSGLPVLGTTYVWHRLPDGGATFSAPGGGWIYVSNSEADAPLGGVGALRFDRDGEVIDAYPILRRTDRNCNGGATPWGTWLSGEEVAGGHIWECDPAGERDAVARPKMGRFTHESAAVDPDSGHVYMTEDVGDGRLYRFVPVEKGKLGDGTLQAAEVRTGGWVTWHDVPDPSGAAKATRHQLPSTTAFEGGEGIWYDDGRVVFSTKGDGKLRTYDLDAGRMTLLYDARASGAGLRAVDTIGGSDRSGDLVLAEDGGGLRLVLIGPEGVVAPLLEVTGPEHDGSELTGPAFSPSGTRLYFSSQRYARLGITYEITGPFRTGRPAPVAEVRSASDAAAARPRARAAAARPPGDIAEPGPVLPDRPQPVTPPTPDAGGDGTLGGAALLWLAAAIAALRGRGMRKADDAPG